jgi:hypothetical protein
MVFKGVHQVPELNQMPGVVVALSHNGWMNKKLTLSWLNHVWGQMNFEKQMLVWDAYKYNMVDSV